MKATTTVRPIALPVNPAGIPQELKDHPQWVVWRYTWKPEEQKWDKPPRQSNGKPASSTDPKTWSTFDQVWAAYQSGGWDGIGLVLTTQDPYFGTDLDGVRDDETGAIRPWSPQLRATFRANASVDDPLVIMKKLDTYWEISPSATGFRGIGRGTVPPGGNKKGGRLCGTDGIELYSQERYLTITGQRVPGTPATVEDCGDALADLHAKIFGKAQSPNGKTTAEAVGPKPGGYHPTDDVILIALHNHDESETIRRLMDGDASFWGPGAKYASRSEADYALIGYLKYLTGDGDQIERIMRAGKLARPEWDERRGHSTLLRFDIDKSLQSREHFLEWDSLRMRAERGELPAIDAGCKNLPAVTKEAWAALKKGNDPKRLFRFGGRIVRTETGDQDELVLQDITLDRARYELAEAAWWYTWGRVSARGEELEFEKQDASPPDKVVRNVLATPDPDLPVLVRVVEAPVFGPDGSLLTEPGYHPAARSYYLPVRNVSIPAVPEKPTQEDIGRAKDLILLDLLGDFPFVADSERTHAAGVLLLPFVRDLIDGPTPLHLIEKPMPGTGATLLVDMLASPMIGRPVDPMSEGRDEDEWRKRITAALRSGTIFILLDNLKNRLDSAALSATLTATTWTDRLLGLSVMVKTPVRCAWIATGNNPALSSEIARRTVRIRLDAKRDRPWLRTGFRHQDIRSWAREHRGELIGAALTLVRAWLAAGKPKGSIRLGMFESWSETLGGIMDVTGIPDFLGNLDEFYSECDAEGNATREFLGSWWDQHRDKPVGVTALFSIAQRQESLDFIRITGNEDQASERARRIALGKYLGRLRDRVYVIDETPEAIGEYQRGAQGHIHPVSVRVTTAGKEKRATLWKLGSLGEAK